MTEYEGVLGKTGEKASGLFGRSRDAYQGASVAHAENDLALACPTCRANGNPNSRMFARIGAGYYCRSGHKWQDMDALMSLSPDKMKFVGIKTKQEGWRELKIEMPGSTLQALEEKYKDKLGETLAAFIALLTDNRCLIVGEEDLIRVEQHLGREIRNGRDLAGVVYERTEKIKELQERVEKPSTEPTPGLNIPGVVVVNLIDVMDKLEERAKTCDPPMTVSEFVTKNVREYVNQGWW